MAVEVRLRTTASHAVSFSRKSPLVTGSSGHFFAECDCSQGSVSGSGVVESVEAAVPVGSLLFPGLKARNGLSAIEN